MGDGTLSYDRCNHRYLNFFRSCFLADSFHNRKNVYKRNKQISYYTNDSLDNWHDCYVRRDALARVDWRATPFCLLGVCWEFRYCRMGPLSNGSSYWRFYSFYCDDYYDWYFHLSCFFCPKRRRAVSSC